MFGRIYNLSMEWLCRGAVEKVFHKVVGADFKIAD